MVNVQVDQMLNLAMQIGKTSAHLSAKYRDVMLVNQNPHKDAEKEQKKRRVLSKVQVLTPAAGCRFRPVYALIAVSASVFFTGCYNILLVNVGGVTKQASTIDHPLAPEVQCAALAQTGISGPITVEAMRVCEQAVATQKEIDALKGKKK
jgi:hypothetical protein